MMKRLVTLLLIITLVFTATTTTFADSNTELRDEKEKIEIEKVWMGDGIDAEYIIERSVKGDSVVVVVKNESGDVLARAEMFNGDVKVTDVEGGNQVVVIESREFSELYDNSMLDESIDCYKNILNSGDINWGNWSTTTTTVHIPKLTIAAFLAAVSVLCPYVGIAALSAAASVFIAGGYKYATIKVRRRFGTDTDYQYAQEEVTIWGRHTQGGTTYKVYGPGVWTQKKPLDY